MCVFLLLIVLVTEAAVIPNNSSDVSEHTEISQDNSQGDLTAGRDGVRREFFVKRTFSGQNGNRFSEAPQWSLSDPGRVIHTEQRHGETHYSFTVSRSGERFFVDAKFPFTTSLERRRLPQVQINNSNLRGPFHAQKSDRTSTNNYKDYISQDSIHPNDRGDDRRLAKDEEVESVHSGGEYAAICTGCDEKRRDSLTTTSVIHRSSSVDEATTAFANRIKLEAQSTTQASKDGNNETGAAMSDIKDYEYFGDEEEHRTETSDGNQAAEPYSNDGTLYFEPKKRNTTTSSDRENPMRIGPREDNGVSSAVLVVETVALDNRNAFDVSKTCGPDKAMIKGGQCVPTVD